MTSSDRPITAADAGQDLPGTMPAEPGVLDRRISLGLLGWGGVITILAIITATILRFTNLDAYAMSQREGSWAYQAWSLYHGPNMPTGRELTNLSPLFLIFDAVGFFLFGVNDVIARSTPAVIGIGMVALAAGLRPYAGNAGAAGFAFLLAISPSMVYASRSVDPMILLAFCSLLLVVSILRAGSSPASSIAWLALAGGALGGMIASGPEGVSAAIALLVAFIVASAGDLRDKGPVAAGVRRLIGTPMAIGSFLIGLVVVIVTAFSHVLSDPAMLSGIGDTFSAWWRMFSRQTSSTPGEFFFVAAFLYEIFAVAFAVIALITANKGSVRTRSIQTLAGTWLIAAFVLFSLAPGRHPDQFVNVALPLLLLAGIGVGRIATRLDWPMLLSTPIGVVPLAAGGVILGVLALIALVARASADNVSDTVRTWMIVALVIALISILVGGFVLAQRRVENLRSLLVWSFALAAAAFLTVFTLRSTTNLAWERADLGTELLAPDVPSQDVQALVHRTIRLSRDLSVTQPSNIDPTGSFGLKVALDPAIQDPFLWYFRDFYDLSVTSPAGWDGVDVIIAPTDTGMVDAGYVIDSRVWYNPGPASYEDLDFGDILPSILDPGDWYRDIRYLMNRQIGGQQDPIPLSVGYTPAVSNQINPSNGPFDLQTGLDLGPGSGLGQLNQPTGIAISPDGQTVYIVDSVNRRVSLYDINGGFLGEWDPTTDPRLELAYEMVVEQGATGISVDENGLVYVADTWNHRVLVVDQNGKVVREYGNPGNVVDLQDSPDPTTSPEGFFGPRDIAVSGNEVFITDTGNERVLVLAPDGTFIRAFGGYGVEPGKLLEPTGIAIGPDNLVYVADSGNARLSVFQKDGTPVQQIPVPEWVGESPILNMIRFAPNGLLYLTSNSTGEVMAWNGSAFTTVAAPADAWGVSRPLGVAVAPNGEVWVTNTQNTDVSHFIPEIDPAFVPAGSATPEATPAASPVVPPVGTPGATPVATPAAVLPGKAST